MHNKTKLKIQGKIFLVENENKKWFKNDSKLKTAEIDLIKDEMCDEDSKSQFHVRNFFYRCNFSHLKENVQKLFTALSCLEVVMLSCDNIGPENKKYLNKSWIWRTNYNFLSCSHKSICTKTII